MNHDDKRTLFVCFQNLDTICDVLKDNPSSSTQYIAPMEQHLATIMELRSEFVMPNPIPRNAEMFDRLTSSVKLLVEEFKQIESLMQGPDTSLVLERCNRIPVKCESIRQTMIRLRPMA